MRGSSRSWDHMASIASEWIVRLDKESSACSRTDFEVWYDTDDRHRVAYLRQLETWNRLDRLRSLHSPDPGRRNELRSRLWRWFIQRHRADRLRQVRIAAST